jgi:hypothetical protein
MRREKTHVSKIRIADREITTNTTENQEIIRDYFENLYSNKFENLEEMDRFLETYGHPKLNQQDINHLNQSIAQNKIKVAIKSPPKRKVKELKDSLLNSIRHLLFIYLFIFYSYVHTMFGSFLPPPPPLTSHYPAETILPLSLMLLEREYKQ